MYSSTVTVGLMRNRRGNSAMMTLAQGLLAVSCYFLWRGRARWGWMTVILVLIMGAVIFFRDVDFGTNLGVQL